MGWGCRDGSDEDPEMCAQFDCLPGHWKCSDRLQCVHDKLVCDGTAHCKDESDEDPTLCTQWNCTTGYWKCADGFRCIEERFVCDGWDSTPSCNDEDPTLCRQWDCPSTYWKCHDGLKCIREEFLCDSNYPRCDDHSDKDDVVCSQWNCTVGKWKCDDGRQCVDNDSRCDGKHIGDHGAFDGCSDRSDESNKYCGCPVATDFPCHNGDGCLAPEKVCDDFDGAQTSMNCADGSDELESVCESWNCSENLWKCPELKCVPLCDGEADCSDASDEDKNMCVEYTCMPGYRKCADNLECVKDAQICDGEFDCNDRSDERCNDHCLKAALEGDDRDIVKTCQEDENVCASVKQHCDGIAHCPDGSDETDSGCTCEDWGLVSCNNKENSQIYCLHKNWGLVDGLDKSAVECQTVIHHINTPTKMENNTGMSYFYLLFSNSVSVPASVYTGYTVYLLMIL